MIFMYKSYCAIDHYANAPSPLSLNPPSWRMAFNEEIVLAMTNKTFEEDITANEVETPISQSVGSRIGENEQVSSIYEDTIPIAPIDFSKKLKRSNCLTLVWCISGMTSRRGEIPREITNGQSEEEELDYDPRAYEMIYRVGMDYPCLSFDIVKDGLGNRKKFPHECYLVGGSQAAVANENFVMVMKLSRMYRTTYDSESSEGCYSVEIEDEDQDEGQDQNQDESACDGEDMSDEDEDENGNEKEAVLETRKIMIDAGNVNRLSMMPQNGGLVALMCENKFVYIYNISKCIESFNLYNRKKNELFKLDSMYEFGRHGDEGFAIGWSPVYEGRLASGDGRGEMYVWNPREDMVGGWSVDEVPLRQGGSVEDIKWSPIESSILCNASTDGSLRIWDIRSKRCVLDGTNKHDCDVNVISWNDTVTNLLASGDDRGIFKIWDLRQFSIPAFSFNWHKEPITSIEWNPNNQSELIVSSDDNSITLWDLSTIDDHNQHQEQPSLPHQLLFIHKGQKDIKEIHWHKQIPGLVISTAYDGFNIWKPNLSF